MDRTPEEKEIIRKFLDERCNDLFVYTTKLKCNRLRDLMDPDAKFTSDDVDRVL